MASSSVNTTKSFKGLESRKSNSWWWDTHIGPRSTKWLVDNLVEMDQKYEDALKLMEEDGDSLAQKAEMYYHRRPEFLSYLKELYRSYTSLAKRYELFTEDVKNYLVPELVSQGSVGFDSGSELNSPLPSQDSRATPYRSGPRAAGFDFFLGPGRSGLDRPAKVDETYLVSDSETESDVSSLHSAHTGEEGLLKRPIESELEAYGEGKMQVQPQDNRNGSLRRIRSDAFDKIYEEELKLANEKIRQSEEEIINLKLELQRFTSSESSTGLLHEFPEAGSSSSLDVDDERVLSLLENTNTMESDVSSPEEKIQTLIGELRTTYGRLQALNQEVMQLRNERRESTDNIQRMQDLLVGAQKDAAAWKAKFETEKRHASERIARYKASLNDRENEVRELKEVISDASRQYQLHAEISRLSDEKTGLEERLREWEVQCHSLETQHGIFVKKLNDEIELLTTNIAEKTSKLKDLASELDAYRVKYDSLISEKNDLGIKLSAREDQIVHLEKQLQSMVAEHEGARKKAEELREEVERQKSLILESAEGKREAIRQLCFSIEHYRNGYKQLRKAFAGERQPQILAS